MSEHSLNSARAITPERTNLERLIDGGQALPPLWREMTNAQALAWLRRRLGLTQAELARMSGVSQSRISKLEAGGDGLLSTWLALHAAMGLGLRLLPTSRDVSVQLEQARGRFRERSYQQIPRARRPNPDTRPEPGR